MCIITMERTEISPEMRIKHTIEQAYHTSLVGRMHAYTPMQRTRTSAIASITVDLGQPANPLVAFQQDPVRVRSPTPTECYTVFYCREHDNGMAIPGRHRGSGELFVHERNRACARGCACDWYNMGWVTPTDRSRCVATRFDYEHNGGVWIPHWYINETYDQYGNSLCAPMWLRDYFVTSPRVFDGGPIRNFPRKIFTR